MFMQGRKDNEVKAEVILSISVFWGSERNADQGTISAGKATKVKQHIMIYGIVSSLV